MKVSNKKKFIVRVIETIVIISTIIFTILAIKYATAVRGYDAIGGEYLIPIGRRDNKTDICADCGFKEAMEDAKKIIQKYGRKD